MNNLNKLELRSSYDYIIVGAGSSGSIVAGKLSLYPNITVLLLEAGKSSNSVPDVWDPNKINCLYNDPTIDWGYSSTPQVHMNNRVIPYSRAKMTGGCSSHNDMVYTRGAPTDFDQWESVYGCTGWSYKDIEHNFQNVEAALQPNTTECNAFASSYIQACEDLGIPFNPDYNSGQNMFGVSPFKFTINQQNTRETSFETFVEPYLGRPNLDVLLFCEVEQVLFDQFNNTTGVQFTSDGLTFVANVTREVILSAGAINTPAILMRSGIGNASALQALGAQTIIADLPGVGQNLQDAIIFLGTWSTLQPIYNQPSNIGYAIVWANMNNDQQPENCCEMMRGNYTCGESEQTLESFYSISGGMMRTKSVGTVTLSSLNYSDKPIIDFNLFSDPDDFRVALNAFNLMRAIGNAPALAPWRNQEITPGPNVNSQQEIIDWIIAGCEPYSHASCTCKMGIDPSAVVTPNLKVIGVNGLRIADTSIMPAITSGHTHAPSLMIGDKAAEIILSGN
ncbi:MAG: choline dehydrogenase [Mucilaginibacter sp.]|nr:choline dehydrogenase [Mucilaginibacter sp.]